MSKITDKAMIELNREQLGTLYKTMDLLLQYPNNSNYKNIVEKNLKIMNKYLPFLIKDKSYTKEQLNGFSKVYGVLKSLYKEGYKHKYYGMIKTLMKSRSLLEDMHEMMNMEELELMCDITKDKDIEIDIDKMFVVRPEGSEYFVDKYDNGSYKPIRRFYKLNNAQHYADYQIGFTERMHEFRGLNTSLFRDENRDRNISIWRAKGRDDAESTVMSSAIKGGKVRKNPHTDMNERFFENLIDMNEERKMLNKKQILDIINQNKKARNETEITELTEELLSKTEKGTALGSILERIANNLILSEKKRDKQI